MGWLYLQFGIMLTYRLYTLCSGQGPPHPNCYNVTVNSTAFISTANFHHLITQDNLTIYPYYYWKQGSSYHCWEIVVPAGNLVEAECKFTDTGYVQLLLFDDQFRSFGGYFESENFPNKIISKSNILDIVLQTESTYGDNYDEAPMECNVTYVEEDTCLQTNVNIVEPFILNINTPDWRIYDCVWFITSPNYTFISIDIVHASIIYGNSLSFGRLVGLHNNLTSFEDSVNLTTSLPNGTTFYSTERNIRMSLSSEVYDTRASSLSLFIRYYEEDQCEHRNISNIEPVPFTIHLADFGIYRCRWFFTSPNYTFIYFDIVHVSIQSKQTLSFGKVFNLSGYETINKDEVSLSTSPPNETSFYFSENNIWLSLSHTTYIKRAPSWSLILRYDDHEGLCTAEQRLCEPENKCLPPNTFCDGNVDCRNYIDESNCDECRSRLVFVSSEPRTLKSPSFPSNYPANLECLWQVVPFRATNDTFTIIEVLNFRTEIEHDVLRIESYAEDKLFVLQGATKVRSIFLKTQATINISFVSDSTVDHSGFDLIIRTEAYTSRSPCPTDTFDCQDNSCVDASARCDGFKDCQTLSDEINCGNVRCLEFYQCKDTRECKYRSVICNGLKDCPQGDDEEDCDHHCPPGCKSYYDNEDLVVSCEEGWNEGTVADIVKITKRLTLSGANISKINAGMFKGFLQLSALSLSGNEIHRVLPGTFVGLTNLISLDISNNRIKDFEDMSFFELKNLRTMLAINIPLESIQVGAFSGLSSLKTVVLIRREPSEDTVQVKTDAVNALVSLENLYVDDYRLCCKFLSSELPLFTIHQCHTTELQPPLNLCGSLMQNNLLRVSMWVIGLSALIGNAAVIIKRSIHIDLTKSENHSRKAILSIMVLNLAVSDFMMGVYMLIIAGADIYYGEDYSQVAKEWRSTGLCKTAGVLSVMSSEASVFIVTLISVDCFHGIVYPFSSRKLGRQLTTVLIILVWLVSLGLSIGPTVLGSGLDSDIYGLSDVCIGLPLLTKPTGIAIKEGAIDNSFGNKTILIPDATGKKPAWIFSIVLFLGINLACFMVVMICYIAIFVSVKRTANKVRMAAHRDREIKIAFKMALIVGTDFACWMPVIVMGILSQTGAVVIGPDIYAWIVVFILPINSSINPYLYTLSTAISEYRSKKRNQSRSTNLKSLDTLSSSISNKTPGPSQVK